MALNPSFTPTDLPEVAWPDRRFKEFFNQLRTGNTQKVVVYGTSLTAGGAWVGAMEEWFEKCYPGQVTVINSGGPGENSDWAVAHLSEKVLAHDPSLVFIEFSYNDAHDKFQMPLERGRPISTRW